MVVKNDNFTLQWDEDDGVQEGTYALYSFVNYGTDVTSEAPIYAGTVTIARDPITQQLAHNLTIQNVCGFKHFYSCISHYYILPFL